MFWHVDRGFLKSVSTRNLKLALMNGKAYTWVLSKLAVNAILKRLAKWLNSFECQTSFFRTVSHCQVYNINIVFLLPEFQGQEGGWWQVEGTGGFYFKVFKGTVWHCTEMVFQMQNFLDAFIFAYVFFSWERNLFKYFLIVKGLCLVVLTRSLETSH